MSRVFPLAMRGGGKELNLETKKGEEASVHAYASVPTPSLKPGLSVDKHTALPIRMHS